jgi:hypothetical protein
MQIDYIHLSRVFFRIAAYVRLPVIRPRQGNRR